MTTPNPLDEPAVLALMAEELTKVRVEAERLWRVVKSAEEAMAPYKETYEAAVHEWSKVQRLAESIAAVIESKKEQ